MNTMKFITKNSSHSTSHIEKFIGATVSTKFLCLQIDNHINWKNHIEKMIPKLSGACCVVRLMIHISNIKTLKLIYYACFDSVMKYGIIFGVTLLTVGRFSPCKIKSSE
jgi:hypothetical protein